MFNTQLARAGAELTRGRLRMLERLTPLVADAYQELAGHRHRRRRRLRVGLAATDGDELLESALLAALEERRKAELDRGITLGRARIATSGACASTSSTAARTRRRVSNARSRSRCGWPAIVSCTDVIGTPPVLLLDDVFSELDNQRAAALLAHLDAGQTLVTTAGAVPPGLHAEQLLRVDDGRLEAA